MTVLRLADRRDLRFAQLLGAQFGFGAASDAIDQLANQLGAFRRERDEALAKLQDEFDRLAAELRAEFEAEVAALRAELERTKAELEVVRLLSRWPQDYATRQ